MLSLIKTKKHVFKPKDLVLTDEINCGRDWGWREYTIVGVCTPVVGEGWGAIQIITSHPPNYTGVSFSQVILRRSEWCDPLHARWCWWLRRRGSRWWLRLLIVWVCMCVCVHHYVWLWTSGFVCVCVCVHAPLDCLEILQPCHTCMPSFSSE